MSEAYYVTASILRAHRCGRYHYGDHAMVRDCCVAFALALKSNRDQYALTEQHPAARAFNEFSQSLTDAEWEMVK